MALLFYISTLKICLSILSNNIPHSVTLKIEFIQIGCKQSTHWDGMLMLDSPSRATLNLQIYLKCHLTIFVIH